MWSYQAAPLILCAVTFVAMAARKEEANVVIDFVSDTAGIDFSGVVKKMKEVDWYSSGDPSDKFTVFETDGAAIAEVTTPEPSACSLEKLRDVLKGCPTRGKICVALYKVNYPRAIDSSTLKARSILMYGQDKSAMAKALGGSFKATKVSMGFTNFVWGPLKNALQTGQVSPSVTLELADSQDIDNLPDADALWTSIKNSVGRTGDTEGDALKKHVENMNAKAAGASVAPVVAPTTQEGTPTVGGKTESSQPHVSVPQALASAPVNTAKIVKEVEEKLSKNIEDTAKKTARAEVGQAIRVLGTAIGDATRNVGKTWLDKSRGVTK